MTLGSEEKLHETMFKRGRSGGAIHNREFSCVNDAGDRRRQPDHATFPATHWPATAIIMAGVAGLMAASLPA
jgi:hypothetical protein